MAVGSLLIEPHYLGSLEYFVAILESKNVFWEVQDHFVKQTFRNRCYINTPQGPAFLTVPLRFGNRTRFKDVRIDIEQNWINNHKRSIMSAYGKAPFFDYYWPSFESVYSKKHRFLLDLNYEIMTICLILLQSDISISFTIEYQESSKSNLSNLRGHILPKRDYQDRKLYTPYSYVQVFGNKFVENLSILDLLFCEGSNAKNILLKSRFLRGEHF